MAKESLVVHVQKYMKNHKIHFLKKKKQSRGDENNIKRAHTSIRL